ncbi:MAG: PEGA domain-containing protein [Nitrospiria bacterium]
MKMHQILLTLLLVLGTEKTSRPSSLHLQLLAFVLMVGLSAVLGGCGTIINGTSQTLSIDSKPAGATVRLSNGMRATTPQTITLPRSKDQILTFEKEGYKAEQIMITREFNALPTILGNILWLLPGVVVDVLAGGAWTLQPEHIAVDLTKEDQKKDVVGRRE